MEAPNQTKFQLPIMPQRPVVSPDGQAFRTLFDSVQQKQATNMDYQLTITQNRCGMVRG